ncbi:DedA family protein [Paenibacillus sp. JJ1683]
MIGYKAGMHVIERYGHWLFLKQELVEKTHRYYDKYGGPLLLVSFFIPGVRQFIGYFIGEQWPNMFSIIEQYLKFFFIGVAFLAGVWVAGSSSKREEERMQSLLIFSVTASVRSVSTAAFQR